MIYHIFITQTMSYNLIIYTCMKANSPLPTNLIAQQSNLLKQIYNHGQNQWKIVIFDKFNRQINTAHFKMKHLRESNITLYFHIKETRQQLHGVTAIYLIQPTPENIEIIVSDFQEDLYSSVVIHFSSEPPPHLLANFARTLGKKKINALTKINKIEFSCIGFHTISRNLAVLQDNNQILSLICTLKNQPIFVYANRQEQQVDFIKERLIQSTLFTKERQIASQKQSYNIVLFFNRELDYFPVLHHGISYSGLIESIYKLSSNGHRILKNKKQNNLEIYLNDDIWVEKRNQQISEMQLSQQFSQLKAKLSGDKDRLEQFNDLTQRCKRVETHIHTAQELIKEASSRKLMQYNECEMQIYRKRVLNSELKKDVQVLLETTQNESDKIRLILIILLYCQHIDAKEIQEFEAQIPQITKSSFYNEIKKKFQKDTTEGGIIGGKMFKKFTTNLLSNFKTVDKFVLTKYVQKIRDLRENDLRQLGLQMKSFKNISGNDVRIENIIVYCVGGGSLSEEANISKFQPRVIYTADKMLNALDLI